MCHLSTGHLDIYRRRKYNLGWMYRTSTPGFRHKKKKHLCPSYMSLQLPHASRQPRLDFYVST